MTTSQWFDTIAHRASRGMGHPASFSIAVSIVVVWAVSGPIFGFSDTWQLVINTGTTIVTFLMVFLIQHTQNRDGAILQLKLDEVVRAIEGARNSIIDLEELDDEQLQKLEAEYKRIACECEQEVAEAKSQAKSAATE
jgi:low affinity Fe/Cu permease